MKFEPKYRQCGPLLVRTPLLPFEFSDLTNGLVEQNDFIDAAIAIGSSSLYEASKKKNFSLEGKLKKQNYLKRMATRPTPYGLYAGVELGRFSSRTSIKRSRSIETFTRVDMSCIGLIVNQLESDLNVRRHLTFISNPEIVFQDNRIWLSSFENELQNTIFARATQPALHVISLCNEREKSYESIVESLCTRFSVSVLTSESLCNDLINNRFLISDLRFPLDVQNPIEYLISYFQDKDPIPPIIGILCDVKDALKDFDSCKKITADQYLHSASLVPTTIQNRNVLQVDTRMILEKAQLNEKLSKSLARLAAILVKISTSKYDALSSYKRAFQNRFQSERLIPLLTLTNEVFGLGSPYLGKYSSSASPNTWRRDKYIFDLVVRNETGIIKLSKTDLVELSVYEEEYEAPISIDLFFQIIANTQTDIDQGNFKLLVSPRHGDVGAGRAIGRFLWLFPESANTELKELFEAEQELMKNRLIVDANFWTDEPRSMNVALTPRGSNIQVTSGCTNSKSVDNIPLSEILIGMDDDKLYALWSKTGQKLHVRTRNLLNNNLLPEPLRFLVDIALQEKKTIEPFNWGHLVERLPHLPRITFENYILAPARWNTHELETKNQKFPDALDMFKTKYKIPDLVWISEELEDDNQLLLNLSNELDIEILKRQLSDSRRLGKNLYMQEYIDAHSWHVADENHYLTEFVTSFVLENNNIERENYSRLKEKEEVDRKSYMCPPGSEWVYLRLECVPIVHDELILKLDAVLRNGKLQCVRKWFFVRYHDNVAHLRVRFLVSQNQLFSKALPILCDWACKMVFTGLCFNYSIETYNREFERYGGINAIDLVESIFYKESKIIVKYLSIAANFDRIIVAVIFIRSILCSFKFSPEKMRSILVENLDTVDYQMVSADVRTRWHILVRENLIERDSSKYADIKQLGIELEKELEPVVNELLSLEAAGSLSSPINQICQSIIHMHCNRVFGINHYAEVLVRVLLSKYLKFIQIANRSGIRSSGQDL